MEGERIVRCNHCMSIVSEEKLIKDDSADSGERCPVCQRSDALMDMPEYTGVCDELAKMTVRDGTLRVRRES